MEGGVPRTGEETEKAGEGKGEAEKRADLEGLCKGIRLPDTRQAPAWSSVLHAVSTLEPSSSAFELAPHTVCDVLPPTLA